MLITSKGLFPQLNKSLIFSCSHRSCTIFILTSCYFCTQVMLILILNWCSLYAECCFQFDKGWNGQSSTNSQHQINPPLSQQISSLSSPTDRVESSPLLNGIWKALFNSSGATWAVALDFAYTIVHLTLSASQIVVHACMCTNMHLAVNLLQR